jgi:hypothetical protein
MLVPKEKKSQKRRASTLYSLSSPSDSFSAKWQDPALYQAQLSIFSIRDIATSLALISKEDAKQIKMYYEAFLYNKSPVTWTPKLESMICQELTSQSNKYKINKRNFIWNKVQFNCNNYCYETRDTWLAAHLEKVMKTRNVVFLDQQNNKEYNLVIDYIKRLLSIETKGNNKDDELHEILSKNSINKILRPKRLPFELILMISVPPATQEFFVKKFESYHSEYEDKANQFELYDNHNISLGYWFLYLSNYPDLFGGTSPRLAQRINFPKKECRSNWKRCLS